MLMCVEELKFPTLDFPSCVSVNNLSQFTTQDLWRKLIFPLEYVEQTGDGFSRTGSSCTGNVEHLTHSPGPSQLSPAQSSASSASRSEAVPYGSTNTKLKEKKRKN